VDQRAEGALCSRVRASQQGGAGPALLSQSDPGPWWAGLNHVDMTKWSNGGRLRGVRVVAVRWAWRDHGDVPRGLKGVAAARAAGPDAAGVGPECGRGP
jgi:hypothetical protein